MSVDVHLNTVLAHKGAEVFWIDPDATVYDAITLMSAKNVGALLVMEEGRMIGVVSERDYTRKIALMGRSSRHTTVREIISTPVVHVAPTVTIEEALRLMTLHRVRHLPVMEASRVVGVVSIGDLVNWVISAQTSQIRQLEHYISGVC